MPVNLKRCTVSLELGNKNNQIFLEPNILAKNKLNWIYVTVLLMVIILYVVTQLVICTVYSW